MITGLHHFSISVADADRSLAFYRDLGLELVSDREVVRDFVERMTAVRGAQVRIVHLSGHGANLELLEYRQPRGAQRAREPNEVGSAHLCFLTEDIEAAYEWLRGKGVSFRSAPVRVTSGPNTDGRGFYLEDPDGNAVEVLQLARSWPEAERA